MDQLERFRIENLPSKQLYKEINAGIVPISFAHLLSDYHQKKLGLYKYKPRPIPDIQIIDNHFTIQVPRQCVEELKGDTHYQRLSILFCYYCWLVNNQMLYRKKYITKVFCEYSTRIVTKILQECKLFTKRYIKANNVFNCKVYYSYSFNNDFDLVEYKLNKKYGFYMNKLKSALFTYV